MFKKNLFGRLIITVIAAVLAFSVLTACNDDEEPPVIPEPAAVNGMVVLYNPARTLYYVGEQDIDLTGGMFYLTYDDLSVSPNYPMSIAGHSTSGLDTSEAQTSQKITYTYSSYSAEFFIEVSDITIEIVEQPKRDWYNIDVTPAQIDLEGMVIEVTPTSKPTQKEQFEATTRDVTVKGIAIESGVLTVTIDYLGKESTFTITDLRSEG